MILRSASPSDLPKILQLFECCLGTKGGSPTEAFWKWKHELNPFGESPVLLAEDNGEVIGLRAFLCWNWKWGNKILRSYRAVDTATHPEWQGKGIFRELTLSLWKQVQQADKGTFIFNTPNQISKPGYLKMGWKVLGKPPVSLSILPLPILKSESNLERSYSLLSGFNWDVLGENCSSSDDDFMRTSISPDFLRWRYKTIPDRKYGAWIYETGNGAAVLFIISCRKRFLIHELRVCEQIPLNGHLTKNEMRKAMLALHTHFGKPLVTKLNTRFNYQPAFISRLVPEITLLKGSDTSSYPVGIDDIANWRFQLGHLELF